MCIIFCKGDIRTVKSLVDAGADVNAIDLENQTPLHYAANKGILPKKTFNAVNAIGKYIVQIHEFHL